MDACAVKTHCNFSIHSTGNFHPGIPSVSPSTQYRGRKLLKVLHLVACLAAYPQVSPEEVHEAREQEPDGRGRERGRGGGCQGALRRARRWSGRREVASTRRGVRPALRTCVSKFHGRQSHKACSETLCWQLAQSSTQDFRA